MKRSTFETGLITSSGYFQVALKEKMLTKLERDRAVGQVGDQFSL